MTLESSRVAITAPNFLFIGPDKAGSSWLFRALGSHPDVFLSPAKDIYFFDRYYDRGRDWYLSRFSGATDAHLVVGEICHDYLFCDEAPRRIRDTLGEAKILTVLREPADRAFSDYLNRVRSGDADTGSFASAVATYPEIVDSGRYAQWLAPYVEGFPGDQLKVAVFDDLARDPQAFLTDITDWLGLPPMTLSAEQRAPARAAAASRSRRLTKTLRRGADAARRLGLEGVVGRVKSSRRVEAALYREYDERPAPDPATVQRIRTSVRADVLALSELTAIPFASRWGYE